MDSPQLVKSHRGKLLLVHQDYTLTLNKRQNGKFYFRCSHKKPVQRDKQTDRQTDRQTERQTERQTQTQTHRPTGGWMGGRAAGHWTA